MTIGKVSKVGNKLITVMFSEEGKGIQFELEERDYGRDYLMQKSNYSSNYHLFPSEQAYHDYLEKNEKLSEIQMEVSTSYGGCKLTVDQVRRIYEIIKE